MPIITAKRISTCAACGLLIQRGESIHFERATGARHVACSESAADRRYNAHRTACSLCGIELAKGAGHLHLVEHQEQDGSWKREWRATCVDVEGCTVRIDGQRASGVPKPPPGG